MIEVIFLVVLGILWLSFASVCDLRSREIPNWVSFSLILFAMSFRFFYSLFNWNFDFFYSGLIGFGIFFCLGNLFYYGRVFAGGDGKLMIAMGAVLPLSFSFISNLKIFVVFLFLFFFIGGFYGLFWSLGLGIKNFKKFKKEFKKQFRKQKKYFVWFLIFCLGIFLLGFYEFLFFFLGIFSLIFYLIFLGAKAIEEKCLVKDVAVKNLTEGDWLYEDVRIGKKVIKKSWNGLNADDIKLISKYKKKIKVKYGIPFVPVFLISFLILLYLWFRNFWFLESFI